MGYVLTPRQMEEVMAEWRTEYAVYAPVPYPEGGPYSDVGVVRYGEVVNACDIVMDVKSSYSFKECILPLSQTLFFFTEDSVKEADCEYKKPKGAIVFFAQL